jgi:hypothetical protein
MAADKVKDPEEVQVLTREYAMPLNLTPMGRELGIVPIPASSMWRIGYVDGKGGNVPFELASHFTSLRYAQNNLTLYLLKLWDMSDSKKRTPNAVSR